MTRVTGLSARTSSSGPTGAGLLFGWLAFALLSFGVPSLAAPADRSVRELARALAKEKDAVDPALFDELAAHGDAASLKALTKGLKLLKEDEPRGAAYHAFRLYGANAELAPEAMDVLVLETARAKRAAWRLQALQALVLFGEAAVERLEPLAAEHADAACRTLATDLLAVRLLDRDDEAGLVTVLANASLDQHAGVAYLGVDDARRRRLRDKTHRAVLRKLLRGRLTAATLPLYAARLASDDASRVWKLFLLRLVDDHPGTEASRVLHAACGDRDPTVALLAVDLLVERDRYAEREAAFRPLLRSREPALRRAAVLALGRVLGGTPAFTDEVLRLAGSRDEATRMGAAGALVDVGTPAALDALHTLLADPSWSVRIEALQRVALWRQKASIPVLIERLEVETGRLPRDVQAALVAVTRLDLGRRVEAWQRWWERDGATFVVPDRDAREVRTRRTEPEAGASTSRSFYDIRVLSQRVAFVLDVSGSMRNRSKRSLGTLEVSRMDVAKEQLTEVLRRLPDGTLFNVIFFESNLHSLAKELIEMKKSTRAKALRFVREQYAIGATALYPALQLAFDDPLVDTIYLLSDGAPTDGELTDIEEIRAEVHRWNAARHVRIHGIAMGEDSTLLRWLCEDTGGTYRREE